LCFLVTFIFYFFHLSSFLCIEKIICGDQSNFFSSEIVALLHFFIFFFFTIAQIKNKVQLRFDHLLHEFCSLL
jgi:hypothetical protein